MSSLYTNPVSLHKFKYVGNGIESVLIHKFRYIFEAFLDKYKQQIFLSDIEIDELSKEFTNVYVDKLMKGAKEQYLKRYLETLVEDEGLALNVVGKKFIDKDTSITSINKIKSNIDGNSVKIAMEINKNAKNHLFNDFDRDVKFINIQRGNLLTIRMPDISAPANAQKKLFLTDFNRDVVFINKINNNIRRLQTGIDGGIEKVTHELERLKLLNNIDKLTMILNINHSRRLPLRSIGTGDIYIANYKRRMLFNYTKVVTLIDIKKNYSKLLYTRIHNLIKVVNKKVYLSGFFSAMSIEEKTAMLNKLEQMDEINKIEFVRKYLAQFFKDLLRREVLAKYLIKQNINGLSVYKINHRELIKHAGFLYRYKVESRYMTNVFAKFMKKININRKYFYNFAKELVKLEHKKHYLGAGITSIKEIYRYNENFKWMSRYIKDTYNLNLVHKYLDTRIGTTDMMINVASKKKFLKRSNKEIVVFSYNKKHLKKDKLKAVKLCYTRFAKQKIRFNVWKVENSFKDIKKVQKYIDKIKCRTYLDTSFVELIFKVKNISRLLDKTTIKSEKINVNKMIMKAPSDFIKAKNTQFVEKTNRILDKVKSNEKLLDLTYRRISKELNKKYLNKMDNRIYHYEPQFKYLDKTWTRIYIIQNVTKFLEVKRKWWILEHDDLTDKLIIPNIDYPYESEPIMGINKHPVSSISTINYTDVDYGTKEIEVSIRIMQQMLNMLFVMWNGAYSEFEASSTTEAIEKVMSVYYTWLNDSKVTTEMETKKSRQDYLRIYRWFRWEAEKIWIKEKDNTTSTGAKTVGMLVANIIEYMKIHHYNVVPITSRSQLFELDNMMTALQIELWDYYRRPDKTKGKRKYVISTVNSRKIKKRLILKI